MGRPRNIAISADASINKFIETVAVWLVAPSFCKSVSSSGSESYKNFRQAKSYHYVSITCRVYRHRVIVFIFKKVGSDDPTRWHCALNCYFLWIERCFMEIVWVICRPISKVLLVNEATKVEVGFVTHPQVVNSLSIFSENMSAIIVIFRL